jgi:hypothetical protein
MSRGEAIAQRARALVGTRFRAQGRDADGLDCVGLVAVALGRAGVRRDYALRGGCLGSLEAELSAAGLARVQEPAAGDVLVMRAGPGQLHLGVWTGGGLVHADAGLRRVVERPGEVPWPVVGVWRDVAGGELHDRPSTIRLREATADGPPPPRCAPGRI